MRTLKRSLLTLFPVLLLLLVLAVPVHAEKLKSVWHTVSGKGITYYNENGKRVKAPKKNTYKIIEIKGKSYAFNYAGYQVHGWRKIGSEYYYFAHGTKSKGRMLTDKKINGIPLGKDGKAKLKTTRMKRKAALMANYSEWADEITKKIPLASRGKKLKKCYDYLRRLPYRYVGSFRKSDPNYDIWGAEYVYKKRSYDCHPIAAAFAYMANALGCGKCTVYKAQTGKYAHSFTSAGGKYYDVSLGRQNLNSYKLFGMKEYKSFKPFIDHVRRIDQ